MEELIFQSRQGCRARHSMMILTGGFAERAFALFGAERMRLQTPHIGGDLADQLFFVAIHPFRIGQDALAAAGSFEPILPIGLIDRL